MNSRRHCQAQPSTAGRERQWHPMARLAVPERGRAGSRGAERRDAVGETLRCQCTSQQSCRGTAARPRGPEAPQGPPPNGRPRLLSATPFPLPHVPGFRMSRGRGCNRTLPLRTPPLAGQRPPHTAHPSGRGCDVRPWPRSAEGRPAPPHQPQLPHATTQASEAQPEPDSSTTSACVRPRCSPKHEATENYHPNQQLNSAQIVTFTVWLPTPTLIR